MPQSQLRLSSNRAVSRSSLWAEAARKSAGARNDRLLWDGVAKE
jgi:hypothetical protein